MSRAFADRAEAADALAARLVGMNLPAPVVVFALPRGGVPIGATVARALHAPLDLVLVRKIGAPWQPELALAAVAEGNPPEIVIDNEVRRYVDVDDAWIRREADTHLEEIARRRRVYLRGRTPAEVEGRAAIVVDDGIATGTTMRAALKALRRRRPARLVLAVPVAPQDTLDAMRAEVDEVVCLSTPDPFHAVGAHYVEFHQVGDDEVIAALDAANRRATDGAA